MDRQETYVSHSPGVTPANEKHQVSARTFQGIPGLCVSHAGRVFVLCYAGGTGEGPENYVPVWCSDDGGRTWTPPVCVVDPPENDVRAYDATPWIAPDGKLWLFWTQSRSLTVGNIFDGYAGVWCAVLENPDDDISRFRWSAPRRIADGIMMNKPIVQQDGTWSLPISVWSFHNDERQCPADPGISGTKMFVSTDNGKTFTERSRFLIPEELRTYDEHSFVQCRDGSIRCIVRTKGGNYESWSYDGGCHWQDGKVSPIRGPNSRLFICTLKSGRQLLVNNVVPENENKQSFTREKMTAWLSDDDGKNWYGGLLIDGRTEVSYPDGQQAEDGSIWLVHDWGRYSGAEILVSRITEEDIAAGKLVNDGSFLNRIAAKSSPVR